MSVKRRFIAGAVCPECGALDRIQRCQDGARLWMECVACNMQRDLDAPPTAVAAEHDAAVAQPAPVSWKPD